ncbi:hypothetical protein F511_11041 [Dorcoceras hygrometricum]|uniref:BUD13 n=1 Tax=Dorcoceras hygrometricum TaxID=472368 RepID=A0A2Z7AJK7_9LAMI|nr:hypothetical protein F511_11041 [Dorcoceras hygrometricum]
MVDMSSKPASLKDYLKKYTSNDDEEKKKKKKKMKRGKPVAEGVLIVDEDPTWQKPVNLKEQEEDSADEEKPQVDEDIEVKRLKRLEQLRSRRPFGAISDDGSGWVSVSQNSKNSEREEQNSDIYPPSKRPRNDSPSPKPNQDPANVSDADLSPPRQPRKHFRSVSPEAKKMHFSSSQRARNDSPSPGPYNEASDPTEVVSDLSPPRRQRDKFKLSPKPRRNSSYTGDMDSDISPPRRAPRGSGDDSHASSAIDLSPPRTVKNVSDMSPPRKRPKESPLLIDRAKTGLVSGVDIKEEIDRKKKEDLLRFKEMDPSVSGRNAEAVYRNKSTGERMSREEFLQSQKDKQKKDEKPKEIKLEWGKGLAQMREAEARLEAVELEKDKPFARSRDDPDLDRMLKERIRWGDPMAHLVKGEPSLPVLPDLGESEKMKESGFIIPQEIPSHSWIRRGLEAAPNRYGIKPGRHWDGVDRSTGYEKELFKRTNRKMGFEADDEVENPFFDEDDDCIQYPRIKSSNDRLEGSIFSSTMASILRSDEESIFDNEKINLPSLKSAKEDESSTWSKASMEVKAMVCLHENSGCSSSHGITQKAYKSHKGGGKAKSKRKFSFNVQPCKDDLPLVGGDVNVWPLLVRTTLPNSDSAAVFKSMDKVVVENQLAAGEEVELPENVTAPFELSRQHDFKQNSMAEYLVQFHERSVLMLGSSEMGIERKGIGGEHIVLDKCRSPVGEELLDVDELPEALESGPSSDEEAFLESLFNSLNMKMRNAERTLTIIFSSKMCSNDLEVGDIIRLHPPWYDLFISLQLGCRIV